MNSELAAVATNICTGEKKRAPMHNGGRLKSAMVWRCVFFTASHAPAPAFAGLLAAELAALLAAAAEPSEECTVLSVSLACGEQPPSRRR